MSRLHIATVPAPAPYGYPAAFRFSENSDYVKYGQQVFEGRTARGDDYWTAENITQTWYQAETGKIPKSGTGYGGKPGGEGFDGIWLDMSEIVRPTRDGIHGRETISTTVAQGHFLSVLAFGPGSNLVSSATDSQDRHVSDPRRCGPDLLSLTAFENLDSVCREGSCVDGR
jgi:hypothetical protein